MKYVRYGVTIFSQYLEQINIELYQKLCKLVHILEHVVSQMQWPLLLTLYLLVGLLTSCIRCRRLLFVL